MGGLVMWPVVTLTGCLLQGEGGEDGLDGVDGEQVGPSAHQVTFQFPWLRTGARAANSAGACG